MKTHHVLYPRSLKSLVVVGSVGLWVYSVQVIHKLGNASHKQPKEMCAFYQQSLQHTQALSRVDRSHWPTSREKLKNSDTKNRLPKSH